MAKQSMINREKKRANMVVKYAAKRVALKAKIKDMSLSEDDRHDARIKLNKMPRDSSPTRMRNRCALTGRPHGFIGSLG